MSGRKWWKEATVYQIYPASFNDHADNGHGTLLGIHDKIPYLHELGVDIVWLSPVYQSPQKDMGYDISDYQKIDPRYGTLDDWDKVRDTCHARGMKLVMDLVVNHSSNEHAWFKESRSSKASPKRDWYIWHPGKVNSEGERVPPNNWRSTFGAGSAWEWDEGTQEYYLHLFLKEQPDLNWENAEVREAVYAMMRWWLDRGTDGFRMDVINFIKKAEGFPDAPVTDPHQPYQRFGDLSMNRPGVHTFLKEMYDRVLKDYDAFFVGECPGGGGPESFVLYSKPEEKELQMVFTFHHQAFDRARGGIERNWNPDWKLTDLKSILNDWHVNLPRLGGWMSNYIENHDQPRIVTRLASELPEYRARSAKLCAMLHATLTGTMFVFQGQEMGMINVPRSWGEAEYKDVESVQYLQGERERLAREGVTDKKKIEEHILKCVQELRMTARDNGRTPVQWDDSENAGFSKAKPWMRVHDDYKEWNIAAQIKDPDSAWTFWQSMIKLRKAHPVLVYGVFVPLDPEAEDNYTYIRHDPETGERVLVVLNFNAGEARAGAPTTIDLENLGVDIARARLLISNDAAAVGSGIDGPITLDKWCGRIYLLDEEAPAN